MKMLDYENLKPEDIEGEEVNIKVSKDANNSELHCCNKKMKKVLLEMEIPNSPYCVRFEAFKCSKCGKEFLNSEQAEKLDKILMANKIISDDTVVYERAGNFDGNNYFVRFPTQLTKHFKNKVKAEIRPLSNTDFLVHFTVVEKKD